MVHTQSLGGPRPPRKSADVSIGGPRPPRETLDYFGAFPSVSHSYADTMYWTRPDRNAYMVKTVT